MRIDDGYQTLVNFGGFIFGVVAWEKEITPPGWDGGGFVDTTTMRNIRMRTRNAKHLLTLTDFTVTIAYDPEIYDHLVGVLQINDQFDLLFPNGAILSFFGFIDKFMPNANREGEQPTASMTVVPTNQDLAGFESLPLFTPA